MGLTISARYNKNFLNGNCVFYKRTIKPGPAVFCKGFPVFGLFFGYMRLSMGHFDPSSGKPAGRLLVG
jgi:hypothetical protein